MRKVVVLGTALVTAGVSAGALSANAHASVPAEPAASSPTPTPSGPAASSTVRPSPTTSGGPDDRAADATGEAARDARNATSGSASGSATAVAETSAVMVTPPLPRRATFAYGRHPRQRVDVYTGKGARGAGRKPALLLLHGGSWLHGDKGAWRATAAEMTRRGYVVFAANYRFSTQADWPAQRNDAIEAVDFIKRNAARFGADPDRLAVVGSSAGGHLATMLGTFGSGTQRVRAVVALSPVASPFLAFTDGGRPDATGVRAELRDAVVELIGCSPVEGDDNCWPKIEDSAATTHAGADDAPMLLLHSEGDFVPATHATGLRDALARFNVPVTVKVVPGKEHGGAILADPTRLDGVIDWIDDIVKR